MELYNELLKRNHNNEKATIIKKKKSDLNLRIYGGGTGGVNITIKSNDLIIDSHIFSLSNIKTIYVSLSYNKTYRNSTNFINNGTLSVVELDLGYTKKINLDFMAYQELFKIKELLDYFVFSNEKDINKLTSKEYEPILKETDTVYNIPLEKYKDKKIIQDEIIVKDDKKYCLYEILPKSLYQFYNKKDVSLFYESKYLNNSYMDIWIDKDWFESTNSLKRVIKTVFYIYMFTLLIYMFIMVRINPLKAFIPMFIIIISGVIVNILSGDD